MIEERTSRSIKILLAGGGTGGHLYPAIALAEEIQKHGAADRQFEFLFIGSKRGLEAQVLPSLGYRLKTIWIRGWQRGWTLRDIVVNLLFPLRLLVALVQSWWFIKQFDPDLAIGTGGYAAGPPLRLAAWKKIPIFIHEQNVAPGATTRWIASHARRIYVSYEESKKYLPEAIWYGTPLRRSLHQVPQAQALAFFELEPGRPTLLIFGGSQGAVAINRYWLTHLNEVLAKSHCQAIWQTGQRDFELIRNHFLDNPLVYVTPFIHEMGIAYCAADLVISRSGAISIAEMCAYGKPAVLIPLPTAAGNHQEINARNLEKNGAAVVVLQQELDTPRLSEIVLQLLRDYDRLKQMSASARSLAQLDAAAKIVTDIFLQSGINV